MKDFVVIVSFSAIFNLGLLAVISFIKSKNKPANFWLAWMFLSISIAILDNIFIYLNKGTIILYHFGIILNIVWGAYLISFTKSLRRSAYKKVIFEWKLFLPVLIYLPFLILTLVEPHWATDTILLAKQNKMTIWGVIINFTICFYSIAATFYLLVQEYFNKDLYLASKKQRFRIKEILWVMLVLLLFAFIPFMFKSEINYIILYMPIFGQIFFLYVFFRMSTSSELFYEVSTTQYAVENVKYSTIKLDNNRSEEIRKSIIKLMNEEKQYKNSDYTISDLAKQLKVSVNLVSMVINSKLNSSFPDLINSYRVNDAINLLADFKKKNLTIETVAYECGFNNRTSFYKAFKKQTGKLPTDFIKRNENEKEAV